MLDRFLIIPMVTVYELHPDEIPENTILWETKGVEAFVLHNITFNQKTVNVTCKPCKNNGATGK